MAMMEYLLSPRGFIKLSQMLLVVVTLGTWFGLWTDWRDFVTGTVFMAFFTALAVFTQNMLAAPARVLEILLSGVLSLFMVICGIVVLVEASASPVGATCGAFCFFSAVAYGLDVFFAFKIEAE
ncbi:uncharacterized protein LOC123517478 [Portunus trituberculatus]|uniref:uncharacterized protein LOC123517478 n=1 Tax=Portunus trituberculatus TaxID=210409 RepID=UPI001E1CD6D3|nr:uncharacterized protein LOC123517478 [Portunus trituberculatus]